MAPVDWHSIMNVQLEEINDDKADELFTEILQFDPEEEHDVEKLRKLFLVSRSIMQIKALQADVAVEELEQMAQKEGIMGARQEKEFLEQIEDLQQQLKSMQRFGSQDGSLDVGKIGEELKSVQEQNDILIKRLKVKEEETSTDKQNLEKLYSQMELLNNDKKTLKAEVDQLKDELLECHKQVEHLEEMTESCRGHKEQEQAIKLREKNRQIHQLLDEIKEFEADNHRLKKQEVELKEKLEDAVLQMEKTTADYIKLKEALQLSEKKTDAIKKERDALKCEVEDLQEQAHLKAEVDDEIMKTVSERVEEWKEVLLRKDEEIMQFEALVKKLQSQLSVMEVDTDKTSVAVLSKAVEERNQQISLLRQKLDQATKDIEENSYLIENLKLQMNEKNSESYNHTSNTLELQMTIQEQKSSLKKLQNSKFQMEEEARKRDKQLSETLTRMREYEMGEYGLADAVGEIKECKNMIRIRDRQIEELTHQVNHAELVNSELGEQNEALLHKIGMDGKQMMESLKENYNIQKQRERLMNLRLQQEVEKLDEEKVELRQQLHNITKMLQQRMLSSSVPEVLNEETENREDHQASVHDKEMHMLNDMLCTLELENAQLKAAIRSLQKENNALHDGIKEILHSLKEEDGKADVTLKCPALDKLIQALESRQCFGRYDLTTQLKTELDYVRGHNDELRSELKQLRRDTKLSSVELNKNTSKIEQLESQLEIMRQMVPGSDFSNFPIPSIEKDSAANDTELQLKLHLVQAIQKYNEQQEENERIGNQLKKFRNQYAVIRHQLGLLYQQYADVMKVQEEEKKNWENKRNELEEKVSVNKIKIDEYECALESLSSDDGEIKKKLSEMTRKMTTLRSNEVILSRRYKVLQDIERLLRKENDKLKSEISDVEKAMTIKIGSLLQFKEMSSFKIEALQKALDDTVPLSELEAANRQFLNLTTKYRDLLEKQSTFVVSQPFEDIPEQSFKQLQKENLTLKNELRREKEKCQIMESLIEKLREQGVTTDISHAANCSSKDISAIEIKELNERQRADHYLQMYEQQKESLMKLEIRNSELENKVEELSHLYLEQQEIEKELKERLADSVTKEVSEANKQKIKELEECDIALRQEVSLLKEVSDVAYHQVESLKTANISQDKELDILRNQLIDLQAQNNQNMTIGKLYRKILTLQLSQADGVQDLEKAKAKTAKLQNEYLKLQKKCDDRDGIIYQIRSQTQNKIKFLSKVIRELRRQYSGAVPLIKQEKLALLVSELQKNKKRLQEEVITAWERTDEAEMIAEEFKVKIKTLEETVATLSSSSTSLKILEWHKKLEILRLNELRAQRKADKMTHKVEHYETLTADLEKRIEELEANSVILEKDLMDRHLQWEQKELDLECKIEDLTHSLEKASSNDMDIGVLPHSEPSMSPSEQLEQAMHTIKNNSIVISEAHEYSKHLKEKIAALEKRLNDAETACMAREQVIKELRTHIPTITEKFKGETFLQFGEIPLVEHFETRQALKAAQSSVACLKAILDQKEESLTRYRQLLAKSQEEAEIQRIHYQEELRFLQERMQLQHEHAISTVRQTSNKMVNKSPAFPLTNKQLARLDQLEEVTADKDRYIMSLSCKMEEVEKEHKQYRQEMENRLNEMETNFHRMNKELTENLQHTEQDLKKKEIELIQMEGELKSVREELSIQKELALKGPSQTLKNLVDKLKSQLSEKERKVQALSKALTDLRGNMMTSIEENIAAQQQKDIDEEILKHLVDTKTKDLQNKVKELMTQIFKLKKSLRQHEEKQVSLQSEISDLRAALDTKHEMLLKLRQEKEELQKKIDRVKTSLHQKTFLKPHPDPEILADLQQQIHLLEEELKRQQPPEKPYDEVDKGVKVAQWEEGKKWQQRVDKLKQRLKEKDQELETLHKTNKALRDQVGRFDREKLILESKAKRLSDQLSTAPDGEHFHVDHSSQMLKKRNFELEEEVSFLKRELAIGPKSEIKELQAKNKLLLDKVEELEKEVSKWAISRKRLSYGPIPSNYDTHQQERKDNLEEKLLKHSEENLELKFEIEQLRIDVPRLRQRILDLEEYVDALKSELSLMKHHPQKSENICTLSEEKEVVQNSLGKTYSCHKKHLTDTARNSVEERTIVALKKVIEKLQGENEQLKNKAVQNKLCKQPAETREISIQVNTFQLCTEEISTETDEAQSFQLQYHDSERKLTQKKKDKVGYLHEKGNTLVDQKISKAIAENNKLRKELKKVQKEKDIFKNKEKDTRAERDKFSEELEIYKEELDKVRSQLPTPHTMEPRQYKNYVVTKIYEDKVKDLEEELENKTQLVTDLKIMLQEAAILEDKLMREKEHFKEKVITYENTLGTYTTKPVTSTPRSVIQNEEPEIEQNGQKECAGLSAISTVREDQYELLLRENAELRVELRTAVMELQRKRIEIDELHMMTSNLEKQKDEVDHIYHQALAKSQQYEAQLSQFKEYFGLPS